MDGLELPQSNPCRGLRPAMDDRGDRRFPNDLSPCQKGAFECEVGVANSRIGGRAGFDLNAEQPRSGFEPVLGDPELSRQGGDVFDRGIDGGNAACGRRGRSGLEAADTNRTRLGIGPRDRNRIADFSADGEIDLNSAVLEGVELAIRGVVRDRIDVRQDGLELSVELVASLPAQCPRFREQCRDFGEATLSDLGQGNSVLSIELAAAEAGDARAQLFGYGEAGGVVRRSVDSISRSESRARLRDGSLHGLDRADRAEGDADGRDAYGHDLAPSRASAISPLRETQQNACIVMTISDLAFKTKRYRENSHVELKGGFYLRMPEAVKVKGERD